MLDVVFEEAWRRNDPAQARDAIAFWEKLGLVPPAERERRVSELVAIARIDGEVVALSTASLAVLPPLKARFAMYRCAVAPAFRRHDVSYRISGWSRERLEAWSAAHPAEQVAGMAAIIQAQEYRIKQHEPTWPEHGLHLNLVGYTQRGEQIRVAWFNHARVEETALPGSGLQ